MLRLLAAVAAAAVRCAIGVRRCDRRRALVVQTLHHGLGFGAHLFVTREQFLRTHTQRKRKSNQTEQERKEMINKSNNKKYQTNR